jgi:hypothetical protein
VGPLHDQTLVIVKTLATVKNARQRQSVRHSERSEESPHFAFAVAFTFVVARVGLEGGATAMHSLGTKITWSPIFATALPSH